MKVPAEHSVLGAAGCQGWDSEFSSCKPEACPANDAFKCGARQDLVVMLDSSELLSAADFETQKGFVKDPLRNCKCTCNTFKKHTFIHTYVHAYMHTYILYILYIHTYIHTYICT